MASTVYSAGTVITSTWLNEVNTAVHKAQSGGPGTTDRTLVSKLEDYFLSVKDFGAVGDGVTDDTAAIEAADAAACAGTLGLDGATIVSEYTVFFPPGNYKVTALTYRGAPWVGSGLNNTKITHNNSTGPCVNAVGSLANRKLLSITNMTLDGFSATGTAHGLRIGHNYRSFNALDNVRITGFPGPGIYIKEDNWSMSFRDVYLSFNGADYLGTGIYVDATATSLLAFDWFNLQLENNGYVGSSVAGGMELPNSAIQNWKFFGGVWEGNYGDAEARFTTCQGVHIYGTYIETDVGSATDGLIFAGSCYGSINGLFNVTGIGATGKAIRVGGASNITIDQVRGDDNWVADISVEGTAIVNFLGAGLSIGTVTVAAGAIFNRMSRRRAALTDAATIAMDASTANSFYVTLGGNRTMGTPTNPSLGQRITLTVYQDATGSRTLAFNGTWNVTWSNTGNTASTRSSIEFEYDGTYWNQVSAQSPYV